MRPTQITQWTKNNAALEGGGDLPLLRIRDKSTKTK